jgi:hypothetical protein
MLQRARELLARHGYEATDDDIAWAYSEASEDEYAASWMNSRYVGDDELRRWLTTYLKPEETQP